MPGLADTIIRLTALDGARAFEAQLDLSSYRR
jgi:hypothetical protein